MDYRGGKAGAPIPSETMMHFPLFQISPLFLKNFRTFGNFFTILPFPEKCLHFHPPKFLTTFFFNSSTTNFPLFSAVSVHFPLVSRKLFFPPYFQLKILIPCVSLKTILTDFESASMAAFTYGYIGDRMLLPSQSECSTQSQQTWYEDGIRK